MTTTKTAPDRIDVQTLKDRLDVVAVATNLLGPPPGRQGTGGTVKWLCPFHDDSNPSLTVRVGRKTWKCWSCGAGGDAIDLARKLNPSWSFPEAANFLMGGSLPMGGYSKPYQSLKPTSKAPHRPPEPPSGLTRPEAETLVELAAAALWEAPARFARNYLRKRGLTDETIRRFRLGYAASVTLPKADGVTFWSTAGITIPWTDHGRLTMINIRRRTTATGPKYVHAFRDSPTVYPDVAALEPGLPVVIVEGEFDAILLGQALAGWANVITLGASSIDPSPETLDALSRCPRWFIATDGDTAGDKAALKWTPRGVRIRPPAPFKDWCDAHAAGLDLMAFWGDHLAALGLALERAAIMEFDGGLSREEADQRAGLSPALELADPGEFDWSTGTFSSGESAP